MENETQPNIPPVQPLPQTSASVSTPTPTNWSKTLLYTVLGLVIIAVSIFVGIQIGKNQTTNQQPTTVQPTGSPTQAGVNPTVSPTVSIPTKDSLVDWKTYNNPTFAFSVGYPSRFISSPVTSDDTFYLTVAELASKYNESIKIKVINNVDVYSNAQVVEVARREVMDSGFKYTVTPTTINKYLAAITTIDDSTVNSVSITIQHPRKNIYVVLVLPRDISKVEFEQILSSFKFTD